MKGTTRKTNIALHVSIRQCLNMLAVEGVTGETAFWQILSLLFCQQYDASAHALGPSSEVKHHLDIVFEQIKAHAPELFAGDEQLLLSERLFASLVAALPPASMYQETDILGVLYQEQMAVHLRQSKGQYFTPWNVVQLAIELIDLRPGERILDPACGTGGFLIGARYALHRGQRESQQEASEQLFGIEIDPLLLRMTRMNLALAGGRSHLYHMDALEFPQGSLPGVELARREVGLGTIDVLLTNPPFGSDLPIREEQILEQFELAHTWERDDQGRFRPTQRPKYHRVQSKVAPETLFVERALQWLKPGGRLGIIVPNGILSNPADEYIRQWLLRHAWMLASIDLPIETFLAHAHVNILTSLLVLKKKTEEEIRAEMVTYPIFMAVAEKVGVDRRGNTLYQRMPDGTPMEAIDDDLPQIAAAYRAFRNQHPEPGLSPPLGRKQQDIPVAP